MPYVLKQRETSQIFTCMLVNNYQLEYYGVKYWAEEEAARGEAAACLAAQGAADPSLWEVVRLDESAVKLGNVKLKNDPAYRLYLDEASRPVARKAPDRPE
jgi:hypothetical protein